MIKNKKKIKNNNNNNKLSAKKKQQTNKTNVILFFSFLLVDDCHLPPFKRNVEDRRRLSVKRGERKITRRKNFRTSITFLTPSPLTLTWYTEIKGDPCSREVICAMRLQKVVISIEECPSLSLRQCWEREMRHHWCCNMQKVKRGLWSPVYDEKVIKKPSWIFLKRNAFHKYD